jgi:hypothetical protein
MSKGKYKICNWPRYNQGLKQRGALSVWISEEVLEHWYYEGQAVRGGQRLYSEPAIELCLLIRQVYHLALRQTEGFMESLFACLSIELPIPDYSTICRHSARLPIDLKTKTGRPLHDVVLDSTGLKAYGEGEWKVRMYGYCKHRQWRKLHVALEAQSQQVQAVVLSENSLTDAMAVAPLLEQIPACINSVTADGAYDKRRVRRLLHQRGLQQGAEVLPILSLKHNAVYDKTGSVYLKSRDEDLRAIKCLGREAWKITTNYHQRSKCETFMMRYKTIIGGKLKARTLPHQQSEALVSCKALNRMLELAKPITERVA